MNYLVLTHNRISIAEKLETFDGRDFHFSFHPFELKNLENQTFQPTLRVIELVGCFIT